uniref:Uncharacterized protein n=1 Tax=Oryza meridionalis TaxID=40149 RepID=A0A0E0EML5_9ORYZ
MTDGDEAGIEELLETGKMAGAGGTCCRLFEEEKVGRGRKGGGGYRLRGLTSAVDPFRLASKVGRQWWRWCGSHAGWRDRKRASARSDSPDETFEKDKIVCIS